MDERDSYRVMEWRPVLGWPEYEVSEEGDVFSVIDQRIVKPQMQPSGRLSVQLVREYRGPERKQVHHLVAEAFLGVPDNGRVHHRVRHIDGFFLDNRPENLEWEF